MSASEADVLAFLNGAPSPKPGEADVLAYLGATEPAAPPAVAPRRQTTRAALADPQAWIDPVVRMIHGSLAGPVVEAVGPAMGALPRLMPGGESFGDAYRRLHASNEEAVQGAGERMGPVASTAFDVLGGVASMSPAGVPATALTRPAGAAAYGGLLGAQNTDAQTAPGALADVATGAAVTGALGLLGKAGGNVLSAAQRRAAGRGTRVAEALQETTGIRVSPNATQDALQDGVNAVRQQHYKALEEAHPQVTDADLLRVLRAPAVRRHTSAVSAEVANGTRPPSFAEAQAVLRRLRRLNGTERRFSEQIDQLDTALKKAVPGYQEADAAYFAASAPQRALSQGLDDWNAASHVIERAMRGMPADAAAQYRHGRLTEIVRRLGQRDETAVAQLKNFMDAGPEAEAQLRSLFRDREGYEAFQRVLRTEKRAEAINAAFKQFAPKVAAGVGVGSGGALGYGLLRNLFNP